MTRKNYCNKAHKIKFRDELEAKIALARRQHLDKGEKRAYRCGGHWHLTSQDQLTEPRKRR